MKIADFINNNCEASKRSEEFINDWVRTNGIPCLICLDYKPKCILYKYLIKEGTIVEEGVDQP